MIINFSEQLYQHGQAVSCSFMLIAYRLQENLHENDKRLPKRFY